MWKKANKQVLKQPQRLQHQRKENKMATLMNVNNQAMPMGDNTGQAGDGQTGPKRHFKHIGEVESDGGQEAEEFADYAGRQTFADGTNMLAMLHNDNYIKKFKTNEIMVTYGTGADGRILLNKLNEVIAKEKGVKVADLAQKDDAPATPTKKADAKKTPAKK
jgi:hypothetical protein